MLGSASRTRSGSRASASDAGIRILYPADVACLLATSAEHETQRDVLSRPEVAARRRTVDTDDPAVCDNLDRPEDLARLPP